MASYPIPQKRCGLQIKDFLNILPELKKKTLSKSGHIDLGDPETLLLYNQAIFRDFLNLEFTLPKEFLVPTVCNRWAFVEWILQYHAKKVLEVGTGASAILALMFAAMGCKVVGTECSKTAYLSARENIVCNSLQNRISLRYVENPNQILINVFKSISQFDAVVCNPPQYDEQYYQNKLQSIKGFRGQKTELVGGKKGFEFLIKLLEEGSSYTAFPDIYFQLLNTKIFIEVEDRLKTNDYNYIKKKVSFGTRNRLFFRVEGNKSIAETGSSETIKL
ncbi:MAG: RlmF-related methyltransferase [Candidatus Thorarchaeota archaeon]